MAYPVIRSRQSAAYARKLHACLRRIILSGGHRARAEKTNAARTKEYIASARRPGWDPGQRDGQRLSARDSQRLSACPKCALRRSAVQSGDIAGVDRMLTSLEVRRSGAGSTPVRVMTKRAAAC